jgi:hypothetical protein
MTTIRQMSPEERMQRLQELLSWRKNEPEQLATLLAKKYVWRGARLLAYISKNPCFWRNCLDGVHSRINIGYGNEGPATYAFECDARFTDEFGYVQDYKVLDHFFGRNRTERITARVGLSCGFMNGYMPFMNKHPKIVITTKILNKAWDDFLQNPPGDWRINYRQPGAVRTWMRRKSLIPAPRKRHWVRRLFRWPT